VQAFGRRGDAILFQQGVQHDQKVQIHVHHGNSSYRNSASDITTRPAVPADVRELARVLGRAFYDDPPFIWMLPDEQSRERRNQGMFKTIMRSHALKYGGVDVAVDGTTIVGGAIWLPPGHWRPTNREQVRSLPGFIRALGGRLGPASELLAYMVKHHPREQHWYLYAIGVDPAHQGQGVASVLLRSGLARSDEAGLPAYLESSKPENVPLYEHFGFEVTEVLNPPKGAPPLTGMWRDPA
jgi:ribosomal protein S18 acetylase RimI-like enzyme